MAKQTHRRVKIEVAPDDMRQAAADELRQVAAIPVRVRDGQAEICLITTRDTRRWTVPKGWPMKGIKDHRAAAVEAHEEAGLIGRAGKEAIGDYSYWKRRGDHFDLIRVTAYRLDVEKIAAQWPEMEERDVRWFLPCDAAALVDEADLGALIETIAS